MRPTYGATQPLIQLAFRFDDLSPSSNLALERGIIDAFASHKCRATLAVIPFRRLNGELLGFTKERASHLVDAANQGTAEIAQHGFCHEQRGSTPQGKPSEFSGVAPAAQHELIGGGLQSLKEIFGGNISGFVPPWNSADGGTLDALEKLGFHYLSAGWETPLTYRGDLVTLPRTCSLKNMETAVREARRVRFLSPLIIVVMHHYDFSESGEKSAAIDLPAFDRLLGWLMLQPDVTVSPLGEIAARLTARQCRRALKRGRWRDSLHWRLQGYVPRYSLLTGSLWRSILC